LVAPGALHGLWAVHVVRGRLYVMFSTWMFFHSLIKKMYLPSALLKGARGMYLSEPYFFWCPAPNTHVHIKSSIFQFWIPPWVFRNVLKHLQELFGCAWGLPRFAGGARCARSSILHVLNMDVFLRFDYKKC
jgi:hypothetical protein